VSPGSPFIVSRGTQDFTCVTGDLPLVSVKGPNMARGGGIAYLKILQTH